MDDQLTSDTLRAISVMTALNEDPDFDAPHALAIDLLKEWGGEKPDSADHIVRGLLQLNQMLLAQLKVETGRSPSQTLEIVAGTVVTWDE